MENSEKNEFDFEKEVKFFDNVKHTNIVEYNGYLKKSGHLCIFTEPGDFSLHDYIFDDNTDKETTEKIKLFKEQSLGIKTEIKILKDIASVIAYIHSLGYVHRDIKPKNVVLFADGTAKLIDFTSYEKIPTGQDYVFATGHTLKGTTPYKAPENLRDFFELNNKYEKAQDIPENEGIKIYPANDIFAYGILMHDLLYKDNIVNIIQDMYEEDLSEMDFVDIILGDQENKPFRPKLDNNLVHEALNNLLNKCWDDNPDNRPTAKEIVEELERIEQEI
jgi:serine/threonine protein kinase